MAQTQDSFHDRPGRLAARIRFLLRLLLGTLIVASVAINFSSVVARYLFLNPIYWAETVITYLMIWSVFLGAALITWDDRHLNVDIVSAVFSRPLKMIAKLLGAICLFAIAVLVIPLSWQVTEMMVRFDQRTAVGNLPMVIPHSAVLAGFSLMALAGLIRIFMLVKAVYRGDDPALEAFEDHSDKGMDRPKG